MRCSHRLFVPMFAAGIVLVAVSGSGYAQQPKQQPAAPTTQPAPPPELKQIALTERQIQGLLASQNEMDAITSKLPENPATSPDAQVMTELDSVAKKHGFASYAEYGSVAANVDMLLDGFDPETKKFVGFETVLKSQIAEVKADAKMPAKDKHAALDELNASLKNIPTVQFPGNIALVAKYYDKLNDALRSQE
jgi:hypothetical protein